MNNYNSYRDEHNILAMYPYHPVYFLGAKNPKHYRSLESELILKLKELDNDAIQYFSGKIVDCILQSGRLNDIDAICSFPSSDHEVEFNGIRHAAIKAAGMLGITDATGCLVRLSNKLKSHHGSRAIEPNITSLKVRRSKLLNNKRVLLLDDVTTSGTSLVAGELMLRKAGVKEIIKLALCETVYYKNKRERNYLC